MTQFINDKPFSRLFMLFIDAYVETFQPLPNDLLETPIGNISKECYNDIVWFIQDEVNGVKYAVGSKCRVL